MKLILKKKAGVSGPHTPKVHLLNYFLLLQGLHLFIYSLNEYLLNYQHVLPTLPETGAILWQTRQGPCAQRVLLPLGMNHIVLKIIQINVKL